ncbi:MAG TPA: TIR domain-containing protein [Draconibacterium sp.]|nr:TIR domain-containing protein [Draconibacterium sp.]
MGTVTDSNTIKEGDRNALLICNGEFPFIPDIRLNGPAKDAKILNSVFSNHDIGQFKVQVLIDKGLVEVRREISRICNESNSDDTILIYYSGNGIKFKDDSLYLLVNDSDSRYLEATTLDSDFILSQLRHSKCRKIILLIDCCFSGAFFNHNRGIPNGLYAVTSCGADEVCYDTVEGGAFSLAIYNGLIGSAADNTGDGRVTIDELHEFAKKWIKENGFSQNPKKWVWNVPEPIYVGNTQKHVFLSYSREDREKADLLLKALESEGLSVWIDRKKIHSGSWKERVMEGLNKARALVFLMTKESLNSLVVKKEIDFATKKKIPIIPVQIDAKMDDFLPDWYLLEYDELHRHLIISENYIEGVKELVLAIQNVK